MAPGALVAMEGLPRWQVAPSTAEKTRLRNAPIATVMPMPWSTGMLEKDSMPKPITVQRFAMVTDAISARAGPPKARDARTARSSWIRRRPQQQPNQMEDRELLAQRGQQRHRDDHRCRHRYYDGGDRTD